MKKIMISVAPVAATDILINPRAIARDVYECYKNGASMVHLHCRDLNGNLTPDLSLLEETVPTSARCATSWWRSPPAACPT